MAVEEWLGRGDDVAGLTELTRPEKMIPAARISCWKTSCGKPGFPVITGEGRGGRGTGIWTGAEDGGSRNGNRFGVRIGTTTRLSAGERSVATSCPSRL